MISKAYGLSNVIQDSVLVLYDNACCITLTTSHKSTGLRYGCPKFAATGHALWTRRRRSVMPMSDGTFESAAQVPVYWGLSCEADQGRLQKNIQQFEDAQSGTDSLK